MARNPADGLTAWQFETYVRHPGLPRGAGQVGTIPSVPPEKYPPTIQTSDPKRSV
jgi:hypothetical protein